MIYTVTLNPAVDRELVVPAIMFDAVLRSQKPRVDWGGKGFNVSRMLMSLGTPSTALGFAGGKAGEMLQDGLHSLGIKTNFVWVEGETRTNISIVEQESGRYIKVNEPGPLINRSQFEQMRSKVQQLAHPGDWWVLSGSLPPGIPSDGYAQLIELLHAAHAHTILDCDGEPLRLGCAARPYLAKPNHFEAGWLTGRTISSTLDAIHAASEIVIMGPEQVVISMGKDGAALVNRAGAWRASSPSIHPGNPIGAGDSLVGGMVWALARLIPIHEALSWGIACGAATASLNGTEVGGEPLVRSLQSEIAVERTG
ncbi:MAG TPA: 1-phosphofructokinase [Levilinea sp.]|nr:1-phosphofructokinase [Levilinea sp.]